MEKTAFLWKDPQIAAEHMKVSPVSILILGKRKRAGKGDEVDVRKTRLENRESGDWKTVIFLPMAGGIFFHDHDRLCVKKRSCTLMACVQAPNHRYNMVHRLKESLCLIEEGDVLLSTQEFEEQTPEDGYPYLSSFVFDDTPIWRFLVNGVEIRKEIGMPQGENTVAVRYRIRNRSSRNCWNLC